MSHRPVTGELVYTGNVIHLMTGELVHTMLQPPMTGELVHTDIVTAPNDR